jgi:GTP-binding protein Era
MTEDRPAGKSGFVAVAGRPNVGKSTLVNGLVGEKVAIVSPIPHTTRHRIRGVYTEDGAQLVLVDLPGWQKPIDMLTERMQDRVDETMSGADVDALLLVLNARERIGAGDRFVARRVFSLGVPVVIVLNKVDRLKPGHIATQMKQAALLGPFHALHPVSAKTNDGLGELRGDLVSLLPEGPQLYPTGTFTDMPVEAQIAELVREQALQLTREEVPHALTAEVVEIEEGHVHMRLYTETESQKQILIGKGGTMVREIGRTARPYVERLLGRKVYLQLQVKASPKWRRNETMLERLGL